MAVGTVMPQPVFTGFDDNGNPLVGGLLYTYTAGTTTPLATYADVALTTPNANPVVLDAAGRHVVYLSPASYKFVLKTSAGVTVWTQDNISSTPPFNVDLDVQGTAGEALTAGQAVYLSDGSGGKTAGRWYLADADFTYASTAAAIVGMVPADIASAASGSIRLLGRITGLAGLTAGASYYISATAGAITATPPTNARFIGEADSTTTLVMGPSQTPTVGAFGITGLLTLTGGQIKFPATQVASADVNTLDDYEEGSFTPVIGGSGGTSGQTYSTQVGRYIKAGKLVHVQVYITFSAKGTITGSVQLQGLPFTTLNVANAFAALNVQWFTTVSNFVYISAEPQANTTAATLYGATAAGTALNALVTADIGNTTTFAISGTYIADA